MKKFLTYSIVAATIAWSLGLSAILPASAAVAVDGDVIKTATSNAVYYVAGGKKMLMVNRGTYSSWSNAIGDTENNFANLKVVSQADFDAIPYGANATVRPGTELIHFTDAPTVYYAVSPEGKLYKLADEAAKTALYPGVAAVALTSSFRANYYDNGNPVGTLTATSMYPDGTLVKSADAADVYIIEGGMKRPISTDAWAANYLKAAWIRTTDVTGYTTGASVTGKEAWSSVPTDGEVVIPGGNLSVSLSSATPYAGNVVANVDNVPFTKFILSAGTGNSVQVNSIKIGRTGLGQTSDFATVTLYDGSVKLGSTRTSWDSNNTMVFNIPNGLVIPAGESKEITVVAKVSGTGSYTGSYNALGVVEVGIAAGSVAGLPVYGNQMSAVRVTVGTATITNLGTDSTKRIGTNDVTLAQFRLQIDSKEDASFQKITLKNKAATNNASDNDISNLYLYKGATKLAGPVQMISDKVTFVLDSAVAIDKSQSEDFKVVGDVVDGNGNKVELMLDATTDLTVIGKIYNTNLSVTSGSYNDAGEGATIIISGAELNISYTGTNVDTMDNKTGVVFGTLTLSAGGTDVKITNLIAEIDETDGNASSTDNLDVDSLQLVASDGSTYSGTMSAGGDTNAANETWTFTDEIYLAKGVTRTFTIKGDLPDGIGTDDSYKFIMTVNPTNISAETVPAGDQVSSFSVGSVNGKVVTVKQPYATVKATSLNAGQATVNQEDVVLFQGTIEAVAGDVNVSRMLFEARSTNELDKANWSSLGLYKMNADGTYSQLQLITNSNMTTDILDFESMDLLVAEGSTNKVTFVVKGTVASTISASTTVAIRLDSLTVKDTDNNPTSAKDANGTVITNGAELTTTRTIDLGGTGLLYVSLLNADEGFNKDRYVLAGTGQWIAKVRVKANYEDVKIKDLKLTNANGTSDDSVSSVCIYNSKVVSDATKVGCTTFSGAVAYFQDLNAVVPQGSNDWYVYAMTNGMSDGPVGTADTKDALQVKIAGNTAGHLTAEGVNSGNTLAFSAAGPAAGRIVYDSNLDGTFTDNETGLSKTFTVVGSKLASFELVSSVDSYALPSKLTNGENILAILKVKTSKNANTDASGDALKLALSKLAFDYSKFVSTTIATPTIEKYGGSVGAVALTDSGTQLSTTTLIASLGNDVKIGSEGEAYYIIKASITKDGTSDNDDYIQVGIDNLTTGLEWFDGYDGTYAGGSALSGLLFDSNKIDGTKISE